jgi:hypothetical protein
MASYQIDQRGGHYDDLRAGAVAALVANVHRNQKVRKTPFSALEFTPWNELARAEAESESVPVQLDDPEAHSNLILAKMFPKQNG